MSKKNLIIVALTLGVVALLLQFFPNRNNTQNSIVGKGLINADIASNIDEVEITEAESSLHLKRIGKQWNILEKDNYPVNMEKLFQLIAELAASKVAFQVTKDPKRFAYFKVMDKGDWQSRGSVLTLKQAGQEKFKLLIGKHRNKLTSQKSARVPDGTYIRFGAENAVYLVKENLSYKTDPDEWIRTRLYKIAKDEIKSVTLENPEPFSFSREGKKKDFQLATQAEIKIDQKKVITLLEKLSELSLVRIQKSSSSFSASLTKLALVSFTLFDKNQVDLQLYTKTAEGDKKEYWLKFVTTKGEQKEQWSSLVDLSKNWYFNVYSYQVEPFLQKQRDFLLSGSE